VLAGISIIKVNSPAAGLWLPVSATAPTEGTALEVATSGGTVARVGVAKGTTPAVLAGVLETTGVAETTGKVDAGCTVVGTTSAGMVLGWAEDEADDGAAAGAGVLARVELLLAVARGLLAVARGVGLAVDLLGAGAGAVAVTVAAPTGGVVMAGVVTAVAVAVNVTEVPEAVPEGTAICACIWNDDGEISVAIAPMVQVAAPSPLGQRPVKSAWSPDGLAVRATVTPEAGPFSSETCTVYVAEWPAATLDAAACTLTHSSAEVAAPVASTRSGWHTGLTAASAGSGTPLSITAARQPPAITHAASAAPRRGLIGVSLPAVVRLFAGRCSARRAHTAR
jgi:hypothetical protein